MHYHYAKIKITLERTCNVLDYSYCELEEIPFHEFCQINVVKIDTILIVNEIKDIIRVVFTEPDELVRRYGNKNTMGFGNAQTVEDFIKVMTPYIRDEKLKNILKYD